MTADDFPLLHTLLQRPHVAEWWSRDDKPLGVADVRAKYLPRIVGDGAVTAHIAMLDGRPIGYAQSYVVMQYGDGWWPNETDPGVRGIDQFLAEPDMLGRGIGTRLVAALVELLLRDPTITKIQTDPDATNRRAIRCYEKAGFRALGTMLTPHGPALYMVRERRAA